MSILNIADVDPVVEQFLTDPILRCWIADEWLDPRPLREQAFARPHVRYLVVDNTICDN